MLPRFKQNLKLSPGVQLQTTQRVLPRFKQNLKLSPGVQLQTTQRVLPLFKLNYHQAYNYAASVTPIQTKLKTITRRTTTQQVLPLFKQITITRRTTTQRVLPLFKLNYHQAYNYAASVTPIQTKLKTFTRRTTTQQVLPLFKQITITRRTTTQRVLPLFKLNYHQAYNYAASVTPIQTKLKTITRGFY